METWRGDPYYRLLSTTRTKRGKTIATFQSGSHPDEFNVDYFTYSDHLGSSALLIRTNGEIISREFYTPFGETAYRTSPKSRYRYCGKEKDGESGLYYYGARYYAAWLCRFVSVDPLAEKYAQFSAYSYCFNNPNSYIDKDGKEPTPAEAARMASHVYGNKKDSILTGGWRVSKRDFGITLNDEKSGLKSLVYERVVNGKVTEYVYATAGTENGKDWLANFSQPIGLSDQYKISAEKAISISKALDNEELNFVGHSLGGGEAALNSMVTQGDGIGRKAITFNAAGVGAVTKFKEMGLGGLFEYNSTSLIVGLITNGLAGGFESFIKSDKNISAYIQASDPLNLAQNTSNLMPDVNGKMFYMVPKDISSVINGHDLNNVLKNFGVKPEKFEKK